MFIEINLSSPQPIYEQLVEQIKFSIASGAVQVDEMVPSLRELSKKLALNPNTVARAYRTLQDEGIVCFRRGTGLAVAPGAKERCEAERRTWFERRVRQLLEDAARSRLDPEEVKKIVERELSEIHEPRTTNHESRQ